MSPESRLETLGYRLESPPARTDKPYEPLVQVGRLIYGSGNTSMDRATKLVYAGQVGSTVNMEGARERARISVVNCLAALKAHLGSLDAIVRIVRVTGYVNSASNFTNQPQVINAASELLLEVFGDRGRHARSAIGVAQLPGGATVETEVIVEVKSR